MLISLLFTTRKLWPIFGWAEERAFARHRQPPVGRGGHRVALHGKQDDVHRKTHRELSNRAMEVPQPRVGGDFMGPGFPLANGGKTVDQ